MKANLTKRTKAYLIDITIMITILGLINILYQPENKQEQLNTLTINYIEKNITYNTYITKTSEIYKQIDQANLPKTIINIIYIISYFVIYPYIKNGQTIGKQLTNIKIKSQSNQKLTIKKLFIRNLIKSGLIYLFAIIICTQIIEGKYYLTVTSIIGIIQISLILISILMIFYRKDKKSLHDIIAKTWVCTE